MSETGAQGRPHCSSCGVDMWLARIVEGGGGPEHYVFECKVCGAQTTIAADAGGDKRLEDRL